MKRDTKRIEALLKSTQANRQLVREELAAGASLQHVYDELGEHERLFDARLRDLRDHNKKESDDKASAAPLEAVAPPAPTKKAKA